MALRSRRLRGRKRRVKPGKGLTTSFTKRLSPIGVGQRSITLPKVNTFLRDTLNTCFTWSCFDYLEAIANSTFHIFRLSSIYDPHYSHSTGGKNTSVRGQNIAHQMYREYKVTGVQVEIDIWNCSNCDMLVAIGTTTEVQPPNQGDIDAIQRQENCKSVLLSRQSAGNERSAAKFKFWCPCHMIQGLTKDQYKMSSLFGALTDDNPSNLSMLYIQAWNAHQGGFALAAESVNVAQFGDVNTNVATANGAIGYSMKWKMYAQLASKMLGVNF